MKKKEYYNKEIVYWKYNLFYCKSQIILLIRLKSWAWKEHTEPTSYTHIQYRYIHSYRQNTGIKSKMELIPKIVAASTAEIFHSHRIYQKLI